MEKRQLIPPQILEIQEYVVWWNNTFPLDYWWRKKHRVSFGSKEHNDHCLLDMRFEYEEEVFYRKIASSTSIEDTYKPGTGDWINKRETKALSEKEVDDLFDSIDIDSIEESIKNGKSVINARLLE